ncbi:hypothetical protein QUB70_19425 [Microcoleus sp. A003_D6]|uniref:hypothetical protein n=1 Tax=Microcoleus sp. A003_D6 TaxID=3055266 RepID=UPI002FD3E741
MSGKSESGGVGSPIARSRQSGKIFLQHRTNDGWLMTDRYRLLPSEDAHRL